LPAGMITRNLFLALTDKPIGGYLSFPMPTALRSHLNELASSFANGVLAAIRTASIEDLLAESGSARRLPGTRAAAVAVSAGVSAGAGRAPRAPGRLPRRSAADIGQVLDRIAGLLKGSPKGLRAEEIRQRLNLLSKELPRPLKEGLATGRLGKSGNKRATTYFLKGGGGKALAPAAKKAGRRTAARKK
jgi:hypothetical protein